MYLQTYKNSRKKEYVRISECFKDKKTGKTNTRVIKSFGSLEKLLAKDPDALNKLKKQVDQLNADSDRVKQLKIAKEIDCFFEPKNNHTPSGEQGFTTVNYGVKVYESIWNELCLDRFFDYWQQKQSKATYRMKNIISMLTYVYCNPKRGHFKG